MTSKKEEIREAMKMLRDIDADDNEGDIIPRNHDGGISKSMSDDDNEMLSSQPVVCCS
jgi:hypothetical protein